MSKFTGKLVDFGIAKEGTRGTAESTATYYIPKASLNYDDKIEQIIDEANRGVLEDTTLVELYKKFAEGELVAPIEDQSFGLILLALLGSVSTSANDPESGVHTHTFSVGQSSQHPSLTLFVDEENQDYTYALGMIASLNLEVSMDSYAQFTAGLRSKAGATATLTPSYTTQNRFLGKHATFKTASAQSGLSGASAKSIRSLSLEFTKEIEDDDALGNEQAVDILNKSFAVSGTIEAIYDDQTYKTEMLADTVQALRITLENTGVTIGAATNPKLEIDLHAIKFSNVVRNFGNTDIVTVTADFKAYYKAADSKLITATLINTASSY